MLLLSMQYDEGCIVTWAATTTRGARGTQTMRHHNITQRLSLLVIAGQGRADAAGDEAPQGGGRPLPEVRASPRGGGSPNTRGIPGNYALAALRTWGCKFRLYRRNKNRFVFKFFSLHKFKLLVYGKYFKPTSWSEINVNVRPSLINAYENHFIN